MTSSQHAREIYEVVVSGDVARVCSLLQADPELLAVETPFGSLLHVASQRGHLPLVKVLLELGSDVNRRGGTFRGAAINLAASNGHLAVVLCLVEAGAMLDVSEPESNPLFGAVYGGHLAVVEALVAAGIDYRMRYTGEHMADMSALEFAQERGQSDIAGYLRRLLHANGAAQAAA